MARPRSLIRSAQRPWERASASRPVRLVAAWYARRPFLTTWGLLAAGMVLMMIAFARDAGLTPRQAVTLSVVATCLAAICTWIIFLEHGEPEADAGVDV